MHKVSKEKAKDLLNWNELCKVLGKKVGTIRKDKCSKKDYEQIEELLSLIVLWSEGKKVISEEDFKSRLSEIDLIDIIMY